MNLEPLKKEVDLILYDCQNLEIKSNEDYTKGGDVLKIVNTKIKKLNEKRLEYTKPLDESKKLIMTDFKTITEPLENFVQELKCRMTDWYHGEQARLDAEQKVIDDKAMETAKKDNTSEVKVPIVNNIKTKRGDFSTTTMRKDWVWEITDEAKIPKKYMSVTPAKLTKAVRGGERKIAGVKIYEKSSPVTR